MNQKTKIILDIFLILMICIFITILDNCAIFQKENRRTLNLIEKKIESSKKENKNIIIFPLIISEPVALLLDIFIVHPAVMCKFSYDSVKEELWYERPGINYEENIKAQLKECKSMSTKNLEDEKAKKQKIEFLKKELKKNYLKEDAIFLFKTVSSPIVFLYYWVILSTFGYST